MLRRTIHSVLAVIVVLCAVGSSSAQNIGSIDAEKMAAIGKMADQFIERLHRSLDFFTLNDMFAPNIGTLYRDYPGEFLPFPTPRMAKTLLMATDGATLNRKLLADWNMVYLSSLLLEAGGPKSDSLKAFPPEFLKLAKKSDYLKPYIKQGVAVTMSTPAELNRYLDEAAQVIPALRRNVKPEMLTLRSVSGQPNLPVLAPPASMGFNTAYMVRRETLVLVMAEQAGGLKIISLAAPEN
jgi:hypothetical protein